MRDSTVPSLFVVLLFRWWPKCRCINRVGWHGRAGQRSTRREAKPAEWRPKRWPKPAARWWRKRRRREAATLRRLRRPIRRLPRHELRLLVRISFPSWSSGESHMLRCRSAHRYDNCTLGCRSSGRSHMVRCWSAVRYDYCSFGCRSP